MAGVDVGGPSARPSKSATGIRRPKRRIGVRIDMTPMVDIAFLLLIFYMVTTIFSAPQAMEVSLPPSKEESVPVAESKLLTLRVDAENNIWWNMSRDIPKRIPSDSLRWLLLEQNKKISRLVTLLKLEKESKYNTMVNIIDEIQMVERYFKQADSTYSYRFSLAPFSEFDVQEMQRAKGGGTP
jgi:biopolymer transport protein ExbD